MTNDKQRIKLVFYKEPEIDESGFYKEPETFDEITERITNQCKGCVCIIDGHSPEIMEDSCPECMDKSLEIMIKAEEPQKYPFN